MFHGLTHLRWLIARYRNLSDILLELNNSCHLLSLPLKQCGGSGLLSIKSEFPTQRFCRVTAAPAKGLAPATLNSDCKLQDGGCLLAVFGRRMNGHCPYWTDKIFLRKKETCFKSNPSKTDIKSWNTGNGECSLILWVWSQTSRWQHWFLFVFWRANTQVASIAYMARVVTSERSQSGVTANSKTSFQNRENEMQRMNDPSQYTI